MKNQEHNEDRSYENIALMNNWPLYASAPDPDDEEDEDVDEDEDMEGDWGDVDPAGGPAPTSPGSAV